MPAINQRIPNFLGGVSQQPDAIKFPGQLRVCDNAVPDVTFGLKKRPPGEFVKEFTTATLGGWWYDIIRDGDEKYLVQMTKAFAYDGQSNRPHKPIRIWNLLTGVEQTLTNGNGDALFDYMKGTDNIPYSIQTIQDYTLIANPAKVVTNSNTYTALAPDSGNYAFARLDTIAYNTEYVMYTGNTPSTPKTYWRATALSVTRGSDGNTWDDSAEDGRYAGLAQFSFSDSECENLEGHVTVNAAAYVDANQANYQADAAGSASTTGVGEDFIGYTQLYKTRYTAQVTLKDGGLIKNETKSTALAKSTTVVIENQTYTINVEAVEPVETYEGVSGIGFYKTPRNPDEGSLSMTKILRNLSNSINTNLSNVSAYVIGSGMYLFGDDASKVNFLGGAVNEAMSVIGKTAQDVSRLPSQCRHGYIVQVSNDSDTDSDNYYLKFIADNHNPSSPNDPLGGSGKWEECVRPHNFLDSSDPSHTMWTGIDPSEMPHALVNNRNGTFTFKKLDKTTASADGNDNYWKDRDVGDTESNPLPSFCDTSRTIQKLFFHRNRLGIISDEQVVMSRPGDYFNFFSVSAITTSDDNPIDITVSDVKPAFINHVLPVQKGIMMFSDNAEFLLFTESDIFSPKTARLKKVANYECNASIQPMDLGTSIMFSSNVSAYARVYEATILDDDIPPKILEQTRVAPEYVPANISKAVNSTALGIVTFGTTNSKKLYHYKYFDSGDRRDQSAWYSWTLSADLIHMVYTGGSFYTVTKGSNSSTNLVLSKHEYITDVTNSPSYTLNEIYSTATQTSRSFDIHLDCLLDPSNPTRIDQTATTPEKTVFDLPFKPFSGSGVPKLFAVNDDGMVWEADSVDASNDTVTFNTYVDSDVALGYQYISTIELPTYHLATEANKFDLNGSLRISGMNFELGASGPMEFHLTAKNTWTEHISTTTNNNLTTTIVATHDEFDPYVQYESGTIAGLSRLNKVPAELNKSVRVPIQKKNDKYKLEIKIPDPFSTAIISASWDGNYNQRRHVRR
mgnify:CR=1 FL=1